MKSRIKTAVALVSLIVLVFQFKYLDNLDINLKKQEASEYVADKGTALKLFGMKKFGTGILWIRQTLFIGETLNRDASEDIERNSKLISSLNPYFVENYYASSLTLGMIKKYNNYEAAFDILEIGMKYNPDDFYLRNYYGGIGASMDGNEEKALSQFEKIILSENNPILVNIIVSIYEKKWNANRSKKNLEKLIFYNELLYNTGIKKYMDRSEEILSKILNEREG